MSFRDRMLCRWDCVGDWIVRVVHTSTNIDPRKGKLHETSAQSIFIKK